MISGEQNISAAIGAIQVGAFDYIQKPFALDAVSAAVERGIERYSQEKAKKAREKHFQYLLNTQSTELNRLKTCDHATGLPNHEQFLNIARQAIEREMKENGNAALILLALRQFRKIRDTLGSGPGNAIVREITGRWTEVISKKATLARLDNDEFALLIPELNSTAEAVELVHRLSRSLHDPIAVSGHNLVIDVNAGIAVYPADGTDALMLERSAAAALVSTRKDDSAAIRFHKPEMDHAAHRRLALECGLRSAIAKNEISVYYQPKVDFMTGAIVGMEALARWQSPELGLVSPTEFIAVAEEIGLSNAIGMQVLEKACHDTAQLIRDGYNLRVAVNLSNRQLSDSAFPRLLRTVLQLTGLRSRHLELEITESAIVQDPVKVASLLARLRAFGISIALDDFGTGFSSLGYLKQFPLDVLKIDRSFVSGLGSGPEDVEFIHTIVELAKKLKLSTVVEGVETRQQLETLKQCGCNAWQGFLCSEPVTIDDLRDLLLVHDVVSTGESAVLIGGRLASLIYAA
jgi:diguanylate cyclase (GGDEF)-like protein